MRPIRLWLVFLMAVSLGLAVAQGSASALPGRQNDADAASILEFAQQVNDRFGLVIDPADYEIEKLADGSIIKRKGTNPVVSTEIGSDDGSTTVTLEKYTPPAVKSSGDMTAQGTKWRQPDCQKRTQNDYGWMNTCWQFGDMQYSGATRYNFAVRTYATCAPKASINTELDACYVSSSKKSGSTLYWNDWSPKSTKELDDCGEVNLNIAVGGVGAGLVVHTCEKLVPTLGSAPGSFKSTWIGDAWYPANDVRETGSLIGLGMPWGGKATLTMRWGFDWSTCDPIYWIDQCG